VRATYFFGVRRTLTLARKLRGKSEREREGNKRSNKEPCKEQEERREDNNTKPNYTQPGEPPAKRNETEEKQSGG
jgi:hypothetical protein